MKDIPMKFTNRYKKRMNYEGVCQLLEIDPEEHLFELNRQGYLRVLTDNPDDILRLWYKVLKVGLKPGKSLSQKIKRV